MLCIGMLNISYSNLRSCIDDIGGAHIIENLDSEAIKFLKMRGVNNVIRVVGNSKEALVKFATVTKEVAHYEVKYVPTMEDAEKLLERR